MDGCYRKSFSVEDISAIIERVKASLVIPDTPKVCSLLGFKSLDALKKQAGKPGAGLLLNGIFDLCAEHRLSREYILLGKGSRKTIGFD